ncbi:MAG: tyrosine protein phosphatase [Rhodobiaceae bacterium]|nr:tyrosine protein phosphatase [Rhodobiaceae bacterium]
MLHVCSLSRLAETVERTGASHVLTVISAHTPVRRPPGIEPDNHLYLGFDDITAPMEGFSPPARAHVEQVLDFAREWDRAAPMVVHCWAGISRSTASAYAIACALHPEADEMALAAALRRASPSATPNRLMVQFADDILGRNGRMSRAIASIGRGADAYEGKPFALWPPDLAKS